MEHPELSWTGRLNFLSARNFGRQRDLYAMDLLWSIARTHYASEIPMPGEIYGNKIEDKRTTQEIYNDILNGLGGG